MCHNKQAVRLKLKVLQLKVLQLISPLREDGRVALLLICDFITGIRCNPSCAFDGSAQVLLCYWFYSRCLVARVRPKKALSFGEC